MGIPHWSSRRYDLLHCNCIHFANEVATLLGVSPVPPWVTGLHETGAALLKIPWPLSLLSRPTRAESGPIPDVPDFIHDDCDDSITRTRDKEMGTARSLMSRWSEQRGTVSARYANVDEKVVRP